MDSLRPAAIQILLQQKVRGTNMLIMSKYYDKTHDVDGYTFKINQWHEVGIMVTVTKEGIYKDLEKTLEGESPFWNALEEALRLSFHGQPNAKELAKWVVNYDRFAYPQLWNKPDEAVSVLLGTWQLKDKEIGKTVVHIFDSPPVWSDEEK